MTDYSTGALARRERLHSLSHRLDEFMPDIHDGPRAHAAAAVVRMIEAWREIHTNWGAADLGLADTDGEAIRWEKSMAMAGEGIYRLAIRVIDE